MGLFQKAPRTAEEVALTRPLDLGPDKVQEMSEREWYAKIYRGDSVAQLTVRAVVTGSIFGFVLAFTNLYVGLTAGWSLGVVITAALVGFALWQLLLALRLARSPMGPLEMNCMASTASSAGYATGGTMVSAIPAMLMLSATVANPKGTPIPLPIVMAWTASVGFLGTVMAIPMKRNMVNQERLRFPTGTAAAVTIQALYTEGKEAMKKARALLWTAGISGLLPFLFELRVGATKFGQWLGLKRDSLVPTQINFLDWLPGPAKMPRTGIATVPSQWTWFLDLSAPYMAAAGMLIGLRTTFSMLIGGLVIYYGLAPMAVGWEWTNPQGVVVTAITAPSRVYREAGLWLGVSALVASSLLAFGLQWKTIGRAFRGLGKSGTAGDEAHEARVRETEVPITWFLAGMAIFGGLTAVLADIYFQVPLGLGILAVVMTFLLCLVACRVTGETDITPMGPLGKIMQLSYGAMIPGNATANLMAASITANASGNSADLLTDLKSGYLLGANPRRQFMAQFLGVVSGSVATAIGFRLLVPDATVLNGVTDAAGQVLVKPEFDAPAAATWKAVADLFQHGFASLHPMHVLLIWWGLAIGIGLVLLETALPKWKSWLPSATGFGFGMIFGFQYAILMLLGALIAWGWIKGSRKSADNYLLPVAGGIIAGYTLLAVVVALLNTTVLKPV